MMNDQSPHKNDLTSLCHRPDALVLLPACAYASRYRHQIYFESVTPDSTIHPIHEPIPGYDHE
jgi:hypothetical protein